MWLYNLPAKEPRRRVASADNREARRDERVATSEYWAEEAGTIAVAVLLDVHALSMLTGVLEDEGVEGYPWAERALDEATWLGVLGGVRVRDRVVPSRFLSYEQVAVRTRGKERVTGRVVQVETDGVSEDDI